jgi:hypothetical protein
VRGAFSAASLQQTCNDPRSMKPKQRRFAFTIDVWDDVADDIIKHVASVDDFNGACAIYEETAKRWPVARVMLRQGTRVVKDTGQRQ